MKRVGTGGIAISAILVAGCLTIGATGANAGCVSKAAVATAESESSAKWYALETMVQSVSWSLWPAYVANGSVPGYRVIGKRFKCKPSSLLADCKGGKCKSSIGAVTCTGQATFCKN